MKTFIAIAALALTTAISAAPATAQMSSLKSLKSATAANSQVIVHKTGREGRRIAAGLALGIIGAAVATHAYGHRYYDHEDRYERRCRRLRRWCHNGNDRACWKYDNRC